MCAKFQGVHQGVGRCDVVGCRKACVKCGWVRGAAATARLCAVHCDCAAATACVRIRYMAVATPLAQQARVVPAAKSAATGEKLGGHRVDGPRKKTLLKEFHGNALGYTASHCLDVLQVLRSS